MPSRLHDLSWGDVFYAFFMGLRFDTVVSGYLLALPFLLLSIGIFITRIERLFLKTAFIFIFLGGFIALWGGAADIPFFNQFFTRLNITAIEWMDTPLFVVSMIFQEWRYAIYVGLFFILMVVFFIVGRSTYRRAAHLPHIEGNYALKTAATFVCVFLIFLGIRGRVDEKSPIRVGTAYFSNNAFLNQLGLNPTFTFIRSALDAKEEKNKPIHLMDNQKALQLVQRYLHIDTPHKEIPLMRSIHTTGKENRINVVVVIMEGMSAFRLQHYNRTYNHTPFLDSMAKRGLFFENTFTSGIHTFNGVFSTLFSFPAIYRQHPMKESAIFRYNGIGDTLKLAGYSTSYFTTHDGQFDNIEGFLRANGFEHVITKANYPSDKIKTTLGVPDDYMFEFAIPLLRKRAAEKKPFFAAFLTASNHGPYYLPDYFTPRAKKIDDQMIEYSDWSLKKFFTLAQKESWYKNTLFVFIADHGASIGPTFDMPLGYNQTPLIFYKEGMNPQTITKIAGQIDIYPTIMGFLNIGYINNTMGIDLRKENRDFILFNGDDKYGVANTRWLYYGHKDGRANLYDYKRDGQDVLKKNPSTALVMKTYAEAHLQAFQYLLQNPQMLYSR
ncbi:MAG TPA: sulfatase-like hydrolase/transferase [Turneriella sp.]|nr:sulfatase-like hydrolase/transferase [Turneriella sp.]